MRGKKAPKRKIKADTKFSSIVIAKFINYVMKDGKKSLAKSIVYKSLDIVSEKTKQDGLSVFNQAMKNVAPSVEVKGKRIGGANYQVPVVVSGERRQVLAFRWLLEATRAKKGKSMAERLADELIAAYSNEGDAMKKKANVHKMAESNKAFAHFAR
ncbi:MAG: 30S ribosomal protein S7 [Patescibacteria group bacterium]|nr:30S ribosomal protein S7 [Patescibacteria group bacterium]MDD4304604.1 30S ribosomal protein S7 [Patescibacteria group bacterium]MDD4695531.1 30S ribosomal protein S7 [Patescibacteria group bacterium]